MNKSHINTEQISLREIIKNGALYKMNVLNKIKSKQAKVQQKEQDSKSLPKVSSGQVNKTESNNDKHKGNQRQNIQKYSSASERVNSKQIIKDKSVKKLLNKVKLKITKQQDQNDEDKQQIEKSKLEQNIIKQQIGVKEQKQQNNKKPHKIHFKAPQRNLEKQKQQSQVLQRNKKEKNSKKVQITSNSSNSNKNIQKNQSSKQKLNDQFPNVYCESLRRYSEEPSEANTDIFDDIPVSPQNSMKKIAQISLKHNRNTSSKNNQKQLVKPQSKLQSFDRDSQGTGSFSFGYKPVPIKNQQMPKNYNYLLYVKKGYQIGRMSVFQGFLQQKKENKQLKLQIKYRQVENTKLSCKNQLIQNPQSISHIFMKKIVQIGEKQYLVGGQDIIKAIEKPSNRR